MVNRICNTFLSSKPVKIWIKLCYDQNFTRNTYGKIFQNIFYPNLINYETTEFLRYKLVLQKLKSHSFLAFSYTEGNCDHLFVATGYVAKGNVKKKSFCQVLVIITKLNVLFETVLRLCKIKSLNSEKNKIMWHWWYSSEAE